MCNLIGFRSTLATSLRVIIAPISLGLPRFNQCICGYCFRYLYNLQQFIFTVGFNRKKIKLFIPRKNTDSDRSFCVKRDIRNVLNKRIVEIVNQTQQSSLDLETKDDLEQY